MMKRALILVGVGAVCLGLLRLPSPISSRKLFAGKATTTLFAKKERLASFIAIGDWGWDSKVHGANILSTRCQQAIADIMLEEFRNLGDVKFVINVGDSFYPNGVTDKSDRQWDEKWRHIYDPETRSVPWYSVYGNHDYIHDPCACGGGSAQCAQINDDIKNLDFFYMPDLSWSLHHPELDLEVVALDLNELMWAWERNPPDDRHCPLDCAHTSCQLQCEYNLKGRLNDAMKLFKERSENSNAKNLVVFSHYPTDYLWETEELLEGLRKDRRGKQHITYFGGHRHSTDNTSTISILPNTNWLVGGGGGWSCDSTSQGIVVAEIGLDHTIRTRPVFVPADICCDKPGPPPPPGPPGWSPKCMLRPDGQRRDI